MTDKRPRNPRKIWALLTITWQPIPNLDPPADPFTVRHVIKLQDRGENTWHAYNADPPDIVTHAIDLAAESTATEAFADPPTDNYMPLETLAPAVEAPTDWAPYFVPEQPLPTAPRETTATIILSEQTPGLEVPPHVSTCPGVSGILGPHVLENRAQGVNARSRAITCARPGLGQQALNARFARGATFWSGMSDGDRAGWKAVAAQRAKPLSAYGFYLGFLLTLRYEAVSQLRASTGYALPLPPINP